MGCKTTILAPSPYSTFSTFSIFHTSNPPSFGIKKIHDGWSRFPVFLLRPPFVFPPKLFSWQQSAVDATPPFRSRASIILFPHSRGAKYAPRCNQPLGSSWIVATRSSGVGTRAQRKNEIVIDLVFAWLNKFDTWMPLSFWYASTEVSAIYSSFYGSLDSEQRKLFDCRIVVHVPWDFSIF